MFRTGLSRYKNSNVNNFTSDIGIKLRRVFLDKCWRKILRMCTSRKIVIEQYPTLDKNEVYIFACNHSFDEDVISALASIDRNAYMLQGTTHQMEHNPIFLAMWLNGMIYVNRLNKVSRADAVNKMERILKAGSSVILFPEGGYNNTENQLIMPLFSSPYILNSKLGVKVIPLITFNDIGSEMIYVRAGEPMDFSDMDKQEAMSQLRDEMSTMVYHIIEEHVPVIKRRELSATPRRDYMEVRKQVYECQKWYQDVWEEEVTYYPGHNVTTPQQARMYVDEVNVDASNAHIMADVLVRRQEDLKYNLVTYLKENMEYSK